MPGDPVAGLEVRQAAYRRIDRWNGRELQTTAGLQLRNDDITAVAIYHTQARRLLDTVRRDALVETSAAGYAQNEIVWTPWLRTLGGLRVDAADRGAISCAS